MADRGAIALGSPSSLLPLPGGSQGSRSGTLSMAEQEGGPRRLLSSPLQGGEVGRGDAPGSADRTGGLPTELRTPAAPPSLLPPGRGAGGMTPPPPTRAPVRDPPPDLPPERGEERRRRPRAPCPAIAVSACHRKISKRGRPAMLGASRRRRGTPSRPPPLKGGRGSGSREPSRAPTPPGPDSSPPEGGQVGERAAFRRRRRSALRSGTAPGPAGRRAGACWAGSRRLETSPGIPGGETP